MLPALAEFWVPEPDEIEDYEGFGLFQDVWPIVGVPVDDAIVVAREDRLLCQVVGDLARDAADFDILAAVVETGSADEADEITPWSLAALAPYLTGKAALEGLEAGVAGLVYALSAAGMFPAASCRGHPEPGSWSALPVVLFAADRAHAEVLQTLVQRGAADPGGKQRVRLRFRSCAAGAFGRQRPFRGGHPAPRQRCARLDRGFPFPQLGGNVQD
jgi:hypothetical protein